MATFFIILLFVCYYLFCLSYSLRCNEEPDGEPPVPTIVMVLFCWFLVPWTLGNAFFEVFDKHYKDGSD